MKNRFYRGVIAFLLAALMVAMVGLPAFAESGGPGGPGVDPDAILTDGYGEGDDGEGEGEDGTGSGYEEDPAGSEPLGFGDFEEDGAVEEGYDFPGMPEGFVLSAAERDKKAKLTEDGVVQSFSETVAGEDYVDGAVVFLTESLEYAEAVAEAYGGELESFSYGVAVTTLPEDAATFDAIKAAADLGNNLPAVYPNFIYTLPEPVEKTIKAPNGGISAFAGEAAPKKQVWSPTFGDPYLKNPNAGVVGYQWFHDAVGTYAAWGTTMGAGITVAVLDTGVQSGHTDLNANVLAGLNTTAATATTNTADDVGHGTHVAGIIAAAANTAGGRGVAPLAKILPVKVLNNYGISTGTGTTDSVTKGIYWVAGIGDSSNPTGTPRAQIINMSLGGYGVDTIAQAAVTGAIKKGIVVIAAAGNDGNNNHCTPATYPGVICVASTDMNGLRSNFSNYGSQVTIAAPGTDILSTYPTSGAPASSIGVSGYDVMSGTSMATPMVSGAAALYLSTLSVSKRPTDAKGVTAVKNALVKQATAAGSPSIGKIVNVGNMFNSVTTLPTFTVKASGGAVLDAKELIPNNGTVTIDGSNFIVYTTDGTAPSVKNGVVANGTGVSGNSVNNIPLNTLPVGKVVIKALCVNGQGTVGKAATLTITTISASGSGTQAGGMSPVSGPAYLTAGKSGTYTAKVTAAAQMKGAKVAWRIDAGATLASINPTKGTLTINQGAASGSVTIRAYVQGKETTVYSTFTVGIIAPVESITISLPGTITRLAAGGSTDATAPANCTLAQSLKLTSGATITNLTGYVAWSSSSAKIATVDSTGKVTAVGNGKATITAKATDGSGKSDKVTITCVVPVTKITITGNNKQTTAGATITLKAAVLPAKPTNKGVLWDIDASSKVQGIAITPAGKLTIPGTVIIGTTVTVTAKAADGLGAVSVPVSIAVVAAKAATVTIGTNESYGRTAKSGKTVIKGNANTITTASNGTVTAVQLFTLNPPVATDFDKNRSGASAPATAVDESFINLSGSANTSGTAFVWSSNKPTVATVDGAGKVTAVGVGSATVTCLASDGSGKKATCTVTVGIPASSLWVQGKNALSTWDNPSLAFGKSLQMNAKLSSAYGKVSNTKVSWTSTVSVYNGSTYVPVIPSIAGHVTISGTGKLSVNKAFRSIWATNTYYQVKVTAAALDGSGVVGVQYVDLCPGTEKMLFYPWVEKDPAGYYLLFVTGQWGGKLYGNYYDDYIITSSSPGVVAIGDCDFAFYDPGNKCYFDYIDLIPLKKGTSTIKVISNDGTGKSASKKVTVYVDSSNRLAIK